MYNIIRLFLLLVLSLPASVLAQVTCDLSDQARYRHDHYANYREVTYWGRATIDVYDLRFDSKDAESLGLVVPEKGELPNWPHMVVAPNIQEHFNVTFKKLFADLPFRNVDEGRTDRVKKILQARKYNVQTEEIEAAEQARWRALYGGRPAALTCAAKIKRKTFPVLYELRCGMSARDDLWVSHFDEVQDIGYSSPEHIAGELKQAVTEQLQQLKTTFEKIRVCGRS